MDERALEQVRLLVHLLPAVTQEGCFALKGGTAINLFVRDLPRLSVDIDLVYLPIRERAESLRSIDAAMRSIAARVSTIPGRRPQVGFGMLESEQIATKLFVRDAGTQVKVETTPVQRGCVYEPATRTVSPTVEERFGLTTARVASFPDLYAGKIVAALDRQHPRDLFDVHHLLSGEGIDESLRTAAVVYLLSHGRPLHALLAPRLRDMTVEYERGLAGLVANPIAVRTLEETRERLVSDLVGRMSEKHKRFLVSFEKGEPEWGLLDVPHAKDLPAVRWRILKMSRQDAQEREASVRQLETALMNASWRSGPSGSGTPPGGPSGP